MSPSASTTIATMTEGQEENVTTSTMHPHHIIQKAVNVSLIKATKIGT